MELNENNFTQICIILVLTGFNGIFLSSFFQSKISTNLLFIISSLLLGLSLTIPIFFKTKNKHTIFLILIFIIAIVKVMGLHIKYGIYLGADAHAEFGVINNILNKNFVQFSTSLAEFPLSYIYVAIVSLISGVSPIYGSWNLIHLISNALISVFIFYIVRIHYDEISAMISAIVVAFNPAMTIYGLSMTRENLALLFLTIGIFLIYMQSRDLRPNRTILYLFVIIALVFSHYTTAYFGLLMSGFILFIDKLFAIKEKKEHIRNYYFLIFFIILFMWLLETIYHINDIRFANEILIKLIEFFTLNAPAAHSHREVLDVFNDFSLTQTLFKIQAVVFVIGSVFLVHQLFKKRLTTPQSIIASACLLSTFLMGAGLIVPSLSTALSPSRYMRFGIIFTAIGVGYLISQISSVELYKWNKLKNPLLILIILLIFVFPITNWIASEYMAFSPGRYPSQLTGEMYNIHSIEEVKIMGFIKSIIGTNTSLIAEWPMFRAMSESSTGDVENFQTVLMDNNSLFNTTSHSYILLRKSLFYNRQYIYYPEKWLTETIEAPVINDLDFQKLNTKIDDNQLVYNRGDYKLIVVE